MRYLRNIIYCILTSLIMYSCYGEEDSFATPDIYKEYQQALNEGETVSGYAPAPIKEVKYDAILNELYIEWDGGNSDWEKREEYIGAEVEFNSLLSGKTVKRVMIPNIGDFGELSVKKRDYNNEISTLRLSKYRTVVVTANGDIGDVRFCSVYKNEDGEQENSEWVSLEEQASKNGIIINKNYLAWQFFKSSQTTPIQLTFDSDSEIRPVTALYDLVGSGTESETIEAFQKWYYMDCAAMSFDPYNMAFDPYNNLTFMIRKEQTGGAYTIDYPSHTEGRGIVYPASEGNPNDAWWSLPDMQHVVMHEMGHCVEWMPNQGKYNKNGEDCDRQGYQEGWPDAVKLASNGFDLATQKSEYEAALNKPYNDPQDNKKFVWQIDYNVSGAFMCWLRLYNGDFIRMLPWTVLMDELTNAWSLEDAVKYILKESYPDITMEELWNEYKTEVQAFLDNN